MLDLKVGQAKEVKLLAEDGIASMWRLLPFILIAGMFGGAYMYYKDTQNRLQVAAENLARAETAARANQIALDELVSANIQNELRIQELNVELSSANDYKNELIGKLRRHNLTALTMQKPGLIETRVNNASRAILEELEATTSNR